MTLALKLLIELVSSFTHNLYLIIRFIYQNYIILFFIIIVNIKVENLS